MQLSKYPVVLTVSGQRFSDKLLPILIALVFKTISFSDLSAAPFYADIYEANYLIIVPFLLTQVLRLELSEVSPSR